MDYEEFAMCRNVSHDLHRLWEFIWTADEEELLIMQEAIILADLAQEQEERRGLEDVHN